MALPFPSESTNKMPSYRAQFLPGVLFTFVIAFLGYLATFVPGAGYLGQLAYALLFAFFYRQFLGYPESFRSGIAFSSKYLLRAAIVLYGLKLDIGTVLSEGWGLLLRDAAVIIFAVFVTLWLAKLLRANQMISLLVGVGTGVCGAAAIAAVAPIVGSKDDDTAISVGLIAMLGTVFSIGYTLVRPLLPLNDIEYGIWSGMSLHEIAHVVLAAAPGGESALAFALLAKLGRVFLLIPLCIVLTYWMNRKTKDRQTTTIDFPWFLAGFLLFSLLGSYVLGHSIHVPDPIMNAISNATTWLLTAAMVGLGLNVSLKDLRTKAMRPLAALSITSAALTMIVYFVVA